MVTKLWAGSLSEKLADATGGPVVHITPNQVLQLGPVSVTNSMLYGWVCMAIMTIILIAVAHVMTVRPRRGLVQLVEAGVEYMLHTVELGFEDKVRARKYGPFFVTLFFFVLINNWLGLIPGVGEALTINGQPLLRPFTADFNGTLAAGVITMTYVYASSIREAGGVLHYLRHFFIGSPRNPLYLSIGLLEMVTDLTRVFSLSLRLFLNVAIGEIIIAVFSYIGNVLAPLTAAPFTALELFIGALQAYIFATLAMMYLAVVANMTGAHSQRALTAGPDTETINVSATTLRAEAGSPPVAQA